MTIEIVFVVLLLSLSSIDIFQSAFGRVIFESESNDLLEPQPEKDDDDDAGMPRIIEVPEEMLLPSSDDEDNLRENQRQLLKEFSPQDMQQLMTLSALAEALNENADEEEEVPSLQLEPEVVTPVILVPSPEVEVIENDQLNKEVDNLRVENDILKRELSTLVNALEVSNEILDLSDLGKERDRSVDDDVVKWLAADTTEEKMPPENEGSYEPIRYIPKNTAPRLVRKRYDEGRCEAISRLTDGCNHLATVFHLSMDEEAKAACTAHQLCYTCAFPLNEAMRGCDDIYTRQTNLLCDNENDDEVNDMPHGKCHSEAEQLVQLMRVEHVKFAEIRATEMDDEGIREMCESPCAVTAMLLK